MLRLEFIGEPVAKAAMKNAFFRGHVHKFIPKKTREFMGNLRAQAYPQISEGFTPFRGALRVTATFRRLKPKHPQKGREAHALSRPDLSNYIKMVEDALNTVVWEDDAQIVELHARKEYGTPGITLEVEEL
jgi:Holliday junction resolvase RusA-like endonuclease